jgi:cobalt-zinc-cadmium efflux system membrane fusion protein
MNKKQTLVVAAIIAIAILLGALILLAGKPAAVDEHGHDVHEKAGHDDHKEKPGAEAKNETHKDPHGHADEHHDEQLAKGPHGGQLLKEEDFGVEVQLAEENGEARFLIYLTNKGKPVNPNDAKVSIMLARPDGTKQQIAFAAVKDGFRSTTTVPEPHVFEATIEAFSGNEPFLFTFTQEEGKIALSDAQIKDNGVVIEESGSKKIQLGVMLPGEIRLNEDRTAHIVPRVVGVVESVHADLGQQVKKGQVLAVMASSAISDQRSELLNAQQRLELAQNTFDREKKLWEEKISAQQDYQQAQQALREAEIAVQNARQKLTALGAIPSNRNGGLNRYEIRAPFDGMVVEKRIAIGESVKEDASIFTVSDLSTVWAEVVVPAKDLNQVRVGAVANVKATVFNSRATGKVSYVSALLGEQTRTAKARVVLPNPQGAWRPGLLVNVEVVSEEIDVPVAVAANAIHSVNNQTVVYLHVPGGFIAQPVVVGRSNGTHVEIVKGLSSGAQYASAGSFIIKSQQGKASAEHTH